MTIAVPVSSSDAWSFENDCLRRSAGRPLRYPSSPWAAFASQRTYRMWTGWLRPNRSLIACDRGGLVWIRASIGDAASPGASATNRKTRIVIPKKTGMLMRSRRTM